MNLRLSFFSLLSTISLTAFSIQEYYSLTKSPRALGMGGAFYSLSDDEYALFYNPAGLGLRRAGPQVMVINLKADVSSGAGSDISTLQRAFENASDIGTVISRAAVLQGKPVHIGAGLFPFYVKDGLAVGLLIADVKANYAYLGSGILSTVDVTAINDSGLVIGKARALGKRFFVGANVKFLARLGGRKSFSAVDIAQNANLNLGTSTLGGFGFGGDLDLGMNYEFEKPVLGNRTGIGFSLNHLFATRYSWIRAGGEPPSLPRMASLGWYCVFSGNRWIDDIIFRMELAEIGLGGQENKELGARKGQIWKSLNLGVEVPIKGRFFLRTGAYQGNVTAGLGMTLPFMRLDFATYAEELVTGVGRVSSRRYLLQFGLGYAGDPAHTIKRKIKGRLL